MTQQEAVVADEYVLTLTCPEQLGIVHAVSGFLVEHGCDIVDNRQFDSSRFYMRVHFAARRMLVSLDSLRSSFARTASVYGMQWQLHDLAARPRVLIMVSKFGHCLNDLLYRWQTGQLKIASKPQAPQANPTHHGGRPEASLSGDGGQEGV